MKNKPTKILLIYNIDLSSDNFALQNEMFLNSAKDLKVELDIVSNFEILNLLDSSRNADSKLDYDAVLFYDKDIMLCKYLENMGLKVLNCSECIEACDNKALMYMQLCKNKVFMPKTIILPLTFFYRPENYTLFVDKVAEQLGLPLVIKEWYGSWGKQVYLCHDKNEIFDIIEKTQGKQLLFQHYYRECFGEDIRINIVGEKIVASVKRSSKMHFQSNVHGGGICENYVPSAQECDLALKAHKALGCDFSGVDILQTKDGPVVCEVNSNAHIYTIYKRTNINVARQVLEYALNKISK